MAAEANRCRLCGAGLSSQPSLRLEPAPAGAQHFLERRDEEGHDDEIALTIDQCGDCGLVQSTAAPVPYYRNVITAAGVSPAMRAHRVAQVESFAAEYKLAGKRAVEIGTDNGYFLNILGEAGLEPHGTEFGGARAPATSHPIVDVYPASGVTIRGGPFEAFFCLNFLEHSPDPREFLRGVRDNLSPDAVGLVEVPNYAQQRRLGRVFDYIADHLSYFDTGTLATALHLSGFVVDRMEETRGGENLEAWVRRRGSAALDVEAAAIRTTQQKLRAWLAAERVAERRVAAWGASHQALTMLAQADCNELAGIFDSAPFKQGRYAPVTRLPILKPTPEAIREVDTVLIIAAGYENEIAATLRGRLKFRGGIFQMQNGRPVAVE